MLNHTSADNVRLHLYKNDRTPAEADVLANYTESAASGYTDAVLTGGAWTFAITTSTSTASYARQTFTYSTSETVYGYYITNNAISELLWAERFTGAPFNIPVGGGSIEIDPKLSLN